jgi:hypothetical protein
LQAHIDDEEITSSKKLIRSKNFAEDAYAHLVRFSNGAERNLKAMCAPYNWLQTHRLKGLPTAVVKEWLELTDKFLALWLTEKGVKQ